MSIEVFPIFEKVPNYSMVDFVGTGFFISNKGVFCTAGHVIKSPNTDYYVGTKGNDNDFYLTRCEKLYHEYEEGSINPRIDLCIAKVDVTSTDYLMFNDLSDTNLRILGFPHINIPRFNFVDNKAIGSSPIKIASLKEIQLSEKKTNTQLFTCKERSEKNMSGSPVLTGGHTVVGMFYGREGDVGKKKYWGYITHDYILERLKEKVITL